MIKRLSIILPLLFALLSFKVSASVMVLAGGLLNTQSTTAQVKENSIHQWVACEESSTFEEFTEEQEEDEDSEFSSCIHFTFYHFNQSILSASRQIESRKAKRKLFLLYKSYKIDCCKF